MTIARITVLREAYNWEQERIQAWIDEMVNHPGTSNPMSFRFNNTWTKYFEEIQKSNAAVIAICTQAIDGALSWEEAARQIDMEVHELNLLLPIVEQAQGAANQKRNLVQRTPSTSLYFEALDEAMKLEKGARDYIENYLVNGVP